MSQAVVLGQAIASADDEHIISIVEKIDPESDVVFRTIEALPVSQIIPFLHFIEKLMCEERVSNLELWIVWLNAIFSTHSTYLSSISDLNDKIGLMTDWMHNRVQNLNKLLQLQGKLELISQQMRQISEPKKLIDEKAIIAFDTS